MISNYPNKEIWKPIEGYETYYVSNLGKVRTPRGKLLKEHFNHKGYIMVTLSKHNKNKLVSLHRLVAKAFIPNPNNLPQINHKDEIKINNFVFINEDGSVNYEKSNLEWCDGSYNQRYSHAKRVNQYDINGNYLSTWDAVSDIRDNLGIPTTNVSKCCKGQIKSINGYIFLYEEDSIEDRLRELNSRKHKSKTEQRNDARKWVVSTRGRI